MNRISAWTRIVVFILLFSLAVAGPVLAQGSGQQPAKGPRGKAAPPPPPPPPPPNYGAALENLSFRSIGPAIMGGRIDDFAVVESDPNIVYVCTASGGVLKSTNGGTTWEPIFDSQEVSTCGDIAIAPSDPSIVYVGTGESNNRQSSSWGNGVYKSVDGGKTWTHVGLKETRHIGRMVVHPTDPNTVYVAAAGSLWGPNKERGVFKTTDGGKTWKHVLYINDDTGVNDIAIDPVSPDTLYAGAYQRRRTVFGFNGSGPGSGLYKTIDGGATWKKLVSGMPYSPDFRPPQAPGAGGGPGGGGGGGGQAAALLAALGQQEAAPQAPAETRGLNETGRIGVNVYRRNPNIVYAIIEHRQGGIFRSEDKGETWTRMSTTNPRPMYYSKIHIDPNNDLRIWVLGAPLYFSEDGGRTFVQNRGQRIHGDYHAMWINPANSNHMIVGTDGGIHWTWDSGRSWDFVNTFPLGQFYEIGADMQKPYRICGGLQDNNSWCGPSATQWARGISNDEWVTVGGGDGFYVQIDPTNPDILYAESQDGNLLRRNMRTGESKSIRPREKPGEKRFRFQWNSPIVISAHNPATIYYGGNFLFKSNDRGDNWEKISPDLTNNMDRNAQPIMGKVPDGDTMSRHDGVQQWPTITTVSESPRNAQILWVGTDDGNLQVTRDGGANWKNVVANVPGLPKSQYGVYVSRVIASHHADGTAYVTFDGHRMNDFGIYVYMTTDFGETWKDISSNLPRNNGIVNVIREHPKNADLLFVGSEYGAFASFDRGASWTKIGMGLPTVPVDDILIHPRDNDLIFGTHGRSIWILDDITPLQQFNAKVMEADLHLFDIRPATTWRMWNHKGSTGHKVFLGQNPPYGALINFYMKKPLADNERIRITIHNKDGQEIRRIDCGGPAPAAGGGPGGGGGGGFAALFAQVRCDPKPGINRAVWNLREASPAQELGVGGGGGGGFGGGGGQGPLVEPGEYTVKIAHITLPQRTAGGPPPQPQSKWEMSRTVTVEEDPRVEISAADRAARREALRKALQIQAQVGLVQRMLVTLRTNLTQAQTSWRGAGAPRIPENVRKAADDLLKKIDEIYPNFANLPTEQQALGAAGPPLVERDPTLGQRIGAVSGSLNGFTAPPTKWMLEEMDAVQARTRELGEQVRKLVNEDLANLNKMMREANINFIQPPAGAGGGPGRGGPMEE